MGAKKIKAVAFWGDRRKEMADEQAVKGFVKKLASDAKEDGGG
jgi:aldehyde:ferredoxin oxidoreductase